MQPQSFDLVDRLAAEYALGTLAGRARRRFERWRLNTPLVEQRCRFWEERLIYLARDVEPVQPSPQVWQGIQRRLNFSQPGAGQPGGVRPSAARPEAMRPNVVRRFAMAASVLLVIGLAALWWWSSSAPRPSAQANIVTESGIQVWRIELFDSRNQLVIRAGRLPSKSAQQDYELWAMPEGGKPVSLGILPGSGSSTHNLTQVQKDALAKAPKVAVSVEPLGGSPTGQPTGAVVFVAPWQTLT